MATTHKVQSASGVWQRTPTPNLVRHVPSGRYYLRARIGRKEAHRESLRTDNYQIARAKLATRLTELRAMRPPRAGEAPLTLWDAVRVIQAQALADPSMKARSRRTYDHIMRSLEPGRPGGVPATPLAKLTATEIEHWWKRTADHYSPAQANYHLMFLRRAFKIARETCAVTHDYSAHLQRLPVPRTKLPLLTSEQFDALVAEMRTFSPPAADWVEFVCYTGTRPEEANSVEWSHIDRAANIVHIHGGHEGTKNRESRRVPITGRLADLLARLEQTRSGPHVLTVRNCKKALHKACAALGLPKLRRYDFRHLFATRCSESGVEIPVLAKWLGHKDGGALAMRTYIHPHNDHEQRAAAKVRF